MSPLVFESLKKPTEMLVIIFLVGQTLGIIYGLFILMSRGAG